MNFHHARKARRHWNLDALISHAFQVKLHCFPNQSFDFFARITHRDDARQVGDVGPQEVAPLS